MSQACKRLPIRPGQHSSRQAHTSRSCRKKEFVWLQGADPQDYQKLKETGICRRCNLERVDLQGAQLKGVNLGGANLKNADLTLTNLESANLGGADLRGAKLDRAFMNEAILCNTIMPDGRIEYSGCLLPTLKQLLNAFEQR